jgi:antitoxin YefM
MLDTDSPKAGQPGGKASALPNRSDASRGFAAALHSGALRLRRGAASPKMAAPPRAAIFLFACWSMPISVHKLVRRPAMIHVSYTDLRKNLAAYMDRANDDRDAILVTRQGKEPVVMMSASEFDGWMETVYLLSSPANAKELLASIAEADAGNLTEHDLIR